jgi:hypothetical protein
MIFDYFESTCEIIFWFFAFVVDVVVFIYCLWSGQDRVYWTEEECKTFWLNFASDQIIISFFALEVEGIGTTIWLHISGFGIRHTHLHGQSRSIEAPNRIK